MAGECVTGAAYNQEMKPDAIVPTHHAYTQAPMHRPRRDWRGQAVSVRLALSVIGLATLLASGCSLTTPPPEPAKSAVLAQDAAKTPTRPPLSPAAAVSVARGAEARAASLAGEARTGALEEAAAAWVAAGDGGAAARVFAQLPPSKVPTEPRALLAADLVAHAAAHGAQRLPALLRHAGGHAHGRQAPRLRADDARVAAAALRDGVLEDELRHLRGLAAARLARHEHHLRRALKTRTAARRGAVRCSAR